MYENKSDNFNFMFRLPIHLILEDKRTPDYLIWP